MATITLPQEIHVLYEFEFTPPTKDEGDCFDQTRDLSSVSRTSFVHLRKTQSNVDLELSGEAIHFLASLEGNIRPESTAKQFPRIINRIASLWKKPLLMDNYFEDLLIDQRGDRKGFPLQVAIEIATLREFYYTVVFPKPSRIAWGKDCE